MVYSWCTKVEWYNNLVETQWCQTNITNDIYDQTILISLKMKIRISNRMKIKEGLVLGFKLKYKKNVFEVKSKLGAR